MSVSSEIKKLELELTDKTKLVAVSKFHPVESIQEAYEAGQRLFGESRVQELCGKYLELPKDIEWHMIGHLQRNKVKQIVPFISLIHSVDSIKLLDEINREGERIRRVVPCLLQIHISEEQTKFGFTPTECKDFIASGFYKDFKFIRFRGLMCMATLTDDQNKITAEFKTVQSIFQELKRTYLSESPLFNELSMGMSDDYQLGIECGSTLVRIGSKIFGNRIY